LRAAVAGIAPVIRLDEVTKVYPVPAGEARALDRLSLEVAPGEFLAVTGPSGSGKSTLLRLIGCLDTPTTGEIQVDGRRVRDLSDNDLSVLRRDRFGFVFQQGNLFPRLSILENVEFPLLLKGRKEGDRGRCREILRSVGLTPDLDARLPASFLPGNSSGRPLPVPW